MKTLVSILISTLLCTPLFSQSYERMIDNEELISENLSATYNARFIKNRKSQDVYDIEVSIRNNSHDVIMLKEDIGEVEFNLKQYRLTEFRFENATGSNLTAKDGNI